jgi:hypothetical protein
MVFLLLLAPFALGVIVLNGNFGERPRRPAGVLDRACLGHSHRVAPLPQPMMAPRR